MRIAFTLLFLAAVGTRAQANQMLDLANQADVIVLGDAVSVSQAAPYTAAYKVRADFVLKGSEPVGSILGTTLSDIGKGLVSDGSLYIPSPLGEMHGLWFLKREGQGYVNVPREMRVFDIDGAFVRLPKFWTPQTGVALERLLFTAALESRRHSLSSDELIRLGEDRFGEKLAINSLLYAERFGFRDLALEFVDELLASPSNEERNLGTLIGVGMTHDPALARLETDLESVRLNPRMMGHIMSILRTHYTPSKDAQALPRLGRLIRKAQKAQIPDLEFALAQVVRKVVQKVKSREMLPLARMLLDSQDPEAVRVASSAFYMYCALTGEDGGISKNSKRGPNHPFPNEQIRSHIGMDRSVSADENAWFWRAWWEEKQAAIAARATEQ